MTLWRTSGRSRYTSPGRQSSHRRDYGLCTGCNWKYPFLIRVFWWPVKHVCCIVGLSLTHRHHHQFIFVWFAASRATAIAMIQKAVNRRTITWHYISTDGTNLRISYCSRFFFLIFFLQKTPLSFVTRGPSSCSLRIVEQYITKFVIMGHPKSQ
jgi:hypothetical protein